MHEDNGRTGSRARLGLCLPDWGQDAFWVQVFASIYERAQTLPVELIPLSLGTVGRPATSQEQLALLEDVVTQELDVLVGWPFPESLAYSLLDGGLAVVHLSETNIRHPLSVSPLGLGQAAEQVATFLADQLGGTGHVLVVGGLAQPGLPDDGKSRIAAISRAFARYPDLHFHHIPSHWDLERARPEIETALSQSPCPIDAILGLSDTLALLTTEIARDLGHSPGRLKIAGINGDPMAIAAIIEGSMDATIETSSADLGARAIELACNIAYGQSCAPHFGYQTRLITAQSVSCVAAEKLAALERLMSFPFELRERERLEHLACLETSLTISRHLSLVHVERALPDVLGPLIRDAYGFEHYRLVSWHEETRSFRAIAPEGWAAPPSPETVEVYRDTLTANRLVLIPDQQSSLRYEQDSSLPWVRSRVVLPVTCGGRVFGLLDLYADRIVHCSRMHLLGLTALADQFGIAIHNARFYRQLVEPDAPQTTFALPQSNGLHTDRLDTPSPQPSRTSTICDRAVAYVHEHYSEPISRGDLATTLGVSENYLTDLFHREMGISLWTYLNRHRIKRAEALLVSTELKITDIATRAGFDDPAYFSRVFRRYTGRSPRAFRKSPPYVETTGD